MKKAIAILLAAVMCLSLAACGGEKKEETKAAEKKETTAAAKEEETKGGETEGNAASGKTGVLKIGAIHDLTGNGSVLGIAAINGSELAVKDINEAGGVVIGDTTYTLELISYDCKSDPNEGISSLERLVKVDDVSVVLGPPLSNVALACVDTTNELKVPFFGQFSDPRCMLGENLDTLNPYMFLVQPAASQVGVYGMSYLVEKLGCKKVGFLIAQDHANCVTTAEAAIKYCEDEGIEIVGIEYNNQADLDMKTQLTNLQKAGADCIFNSNPTQPLTVSTNQKNQLGFDVPQSGSLDFSSPFASLCADEASASNIYFVSNTSYDTPEFQELNEKCMAEFNQEATIKTALGYDQVLIAVAAAQKAGSTDREAIRDALETISGVDTVITDNFCMGADDHMPSGLDVYMYQIENGEYIGLEKWSPDYLK